MLFEEQLAAVEEDGGVEGRFAILAAGRQSHAGQDGGGQLARGGGQLVDRGTAAGEEAGFFKEVGGRIAADGELGEDGKARALIRGAAAGGDEFSRDFR